MILSVPGSGTMGTGTMYMYIDMGMGTGTSPACQESRVWVRDRVRGYRYKLLYPDKYHKYGYNG